VVVVVVVVVGAHSNKPSGSIKTGEFLGWSVTIGAQRGVGLYGDGYTRQSLTDLLGRVQYWPGGTSGTQRHCGNPSPPRPTDAMGEVALHCGLVHGPVLLQLLQKTNKVRGP
jgi:hypothetical protein